MKKVLLLGSNIGSREMVEYIHQRGDYAIVSDFYSRELSEAKQEADESWDISTLDMDELERKCRENHIQAVLASTGEQNLESAIWLAERGNLPFYVNRKTWEILNDKKRFKDLCRRYGLPVPEDYTQENLPGEQEFPVVVKPADNCANRGLSVCRTPGEAAIACQKAYQFSPSGRIIIEKFIQGTQINIFYHMADGKIALSDVMESLVNPGCPPSCYAVTVSRKRYLDMFLEQYRDQAEKMLRELGCRNGTAILQAMTDGENLYFLEINYRLDGLGFFNTLKDDCGIDAVKIITDISIDGKTDSSPAESAKEGGISCIYTLWTHKSCTVQGIEGIEKIRETVEGIHLQVMCRKGMKIEVPEGGGVLLLSFSFRRKDAGEIGQVIKYINDAVRVKDTFDNDVLEKFDSLEEI